MSVLSQIRRRGSIVAPPSNYEGGGGGEPEGSFPMSRAHLGTWILLAAVTMLFAGLSSAYFVLHGLPQWQNITVPRLVWANTLVLLASSISLEFARSAVRKNHPGALNQWLAVTGLLGVSFLAGQVLVWRQLVKAGVYLATTLHSSFFYVLTGAHALHLAGGMIGLIVVLYRTFMSRITAQNYESLKVFALYWHFMDVVWIYCFLLLLLA